jgi:hypothetical protein
MFVLILMMCKYVRAPHTRLFSCRLMETAVVESAERENIYKGWANMKQILRFLLR